MQETHLLGTRPDSGLCAVLDEELYEAQVVQDGLVDGIVLVLDQVDLIGPGDD